MRGTVPSIKGDRDSCVSARRRFKCLYRGCVYTKPPFKNVSKIIAPRYAGNGAMSTDTSPGRQLGKTFQSPTVYDFEKRRWKEICMRNKYANWETSKRIQFQYQKWSWKLKYLFLSVCLRTVQGHAHNPYNVTVTILFQQPFMFTCVKCDTGLFLYSDLHQILLCYLKRHNGHFYLSLMRAGPSAPPTPLSFLQLLSLILTTGWPWFGKSPLVSSLHLIHPADITLSCRLSSQRIWLLHKGKATLPPSEISQIFRNGDMGVSSTAPAKPGLINESLTKQEVPLGFLE